MGFRMNGCSPTNLLWRCVLAAVVLAGFRGMPPAAAESVAESLISGNTRVTGEDVAIEADSLTFERTHNLVRARGNVSVRHGDLTLRADNVIMHTATRRVLATGNVVFGGDGLEWRGERFVYNFNTGNWASGEFKAFFDPFHIEANAAKNAPPDEFQLKSVAVSTCELPMGHAHYNLRARRVLLRPGNRLLAYHAVLSLGRLPVFYLPVWRASFDSDFGFRFDPGSSGSMGSYLLSSYRYRINDILQGETRLDYRSRRGLAGGQMLNWRKQADSAYDGRLTAYYVDDLDPYLDRDPARLELDSSRYRLQLRHRHSLGERHALQTRLEYVSDAKMREDFFERDYRREVQPDNFLAYSYRRDGYAAGMLARMRLNDFNEHVDRLPEAYWDLHRRRLWNTPVFYESSHAAVALRRRQSADSTQKDTAVERVDTRHLLIWPTRIFGFLNVAPRAGGRATYYSETLTDDGEAGGDLRLAADFGIESSFQAARVWNTRPAPWGQHLRHVIEPYANYTYAPEPSVTPDRLHRFDEIDAVDKAHVLAFGLRNVMQTKRDQRSHDLLDVNIYSDYRLDAPESENALGVLRLRAEARPSESWGMDMTALYDPHDEVSHELNNRLFYEQAGRWRLDLDHRYVYQRSRLISATLGLVPLPDWKLEAYGRYEFANTRIEEYAFYAQRALDCMVIRGGFSHLPSHVRTDGTHREDEYRLTLEIWLTAFPEMRAGIHQRH